MRHDNLTAVIPHYNTPKSLLARAIKSLDKYGIKYIIVDDGSDEKHKAGLLQYKDRVIFLKENKGQGYANYVGFYAVETKWAMRMDSDDYLTTDPSYDDEAVVHTQASIYPQPKSANELFAKPYAYLAGAVARSSVYVKVYSDIVSVRMMEDIEAMGNMFGNNMTMKHHDTIWYAYESKREGSVTGSRTPGECSAIKKKIIKAHALKFKTR